MKHPSFSEDNSLSLPVITTKSGKKEYRINCYRLNGEYYIKEKEIIKVGNRWVFKENTIFDHETKEHKNSPYGLRNGIVGLSSKGFEYGYFSPNPYTNVILHYDGKKVDLINPLVLKDYISECYSEGLFYTNAELSRSMKLKMTAKTLAVNNDNNVYNIIDNPNQFSRQIDLYNNNNIVTDKDMRLYGKYLKNTTFGFEIETINGYLPEHIRNQYGIIICKDGSLRQEGKYPPEYVTVPLEGLKGMQCIRNVSKEITLRSDINTSCSLHLHLGGFDISRIFMVSLYSLACKIQDAMFEMVPFYKRDEIRYAGKEKNYCQKLPEIIAPYNKDCDFNNYINYAYQDIFSFLTAGQKLDSEFNFKAKRNPWGEHKWNMKTRYYWLNFTNILFGKHNTVEFRLHEPTTNGDKMLNWLFICNAIVKFAQEYPLKCLNTEKVTIDEVLDVYLITKKASAKRLTHALKNYYSERCATFKKAHEEGDDLGKQDIAEDPLYTFSIFK